jgi:hypothetical protein
MLCTLTSLSADSSHEPCCVKRCNSVASNMNVALRGITAASLPCLWNISLTVTACFMRSFRGKRGDDGRGRELGGAKQGALFVGIGGAGWGAKRVHPLKLRPRWRELTF